MAQTDNTKQNAQHKTTLKAAHSKKHSRRHGTPHTTTLRRTLRREAPSTVGLLVDAQDFAAMRRYGTFPFDDHTVYLQQVEALLKTLTAQGVHTTVALFDPEDYEEFCTESGLDADTGASRSRFTAEIAAAGATVTYTGQSIDDLIPVLVSRAVRQATWEYATLLLADLGTCADCGQDIGRAAFDRASHLLMRLLETAGPGTHHLVCSVPTDNDQLLAVLHTHRDTTGPARLDSAEGAEFATVLAVAVALESRGGVVLRTSAPESPDRVHGWRLAHGGLAPLTAGEVFNAYCTDADTGEPVSPESGVEYCAGFDIGAEPPETHH
ncbi:hypothetical protein ABZV81_15435 [Streptomyces parvus]|uniref:hypothetical protein n=1 Tax=Streptomyces parvus TaxID=66428 RepID=UPI0033A55428